MAYSTAANTPHTSAGLGEVWEEMVTGSSIAGRVKMVVKSWSLTSFASSLRDANIFFFRVGLALHLTVPRGEEL